MSHLRENTQCETCGAGDAPCDTGMRAGLQRAIEPLKREALGYPGSEWSGEVRAGLSVLATELKKLKA